MAILESDAFEEEILSSIERVEAELQALPWRAFIRRHRKRSELKRWRKALRAFRGEHVAERNAGILGRLIGGILRSG